MSKKLTPWFPGDVKPVRRGYYERDWGGDGNLADYTPDFWNGVHWQNAYRSTSRLDPLCCSPQCFKWRGLAEKP